MIFSFREVDLFIWNKWSAVTSKQNGQIPRFKSIRNSFKLLIQFYFRHGPIVFERQCYFGN